MDRDEILRVLRAFEAAGLGVMLIGATAMGLHGLVRATEEFDLFIRATQNVERLRAALRDAYNGDPHIEDISSADLLGQSRHPLLSADGQSVLRRARAGSAGRTFEETVDAEIKEITGTRVRVATPAALYRLKKGTVQPRIIRTLRHCARVST